ncbi:MAG: hypothetical protein FWD51_02095 [Betaproteobacteria bacterium]|nr:hypothetical protein [Betaproteobacteria bacterium]
MQPKAFKQVALVLQPDFGERLIQLVELMPVWIIESSQNRVAVEKIRNTKLLRSAIPITTFQAKEGELLKTVCERIVLSLEDHYNEYSQIPSYNELKVIGISLTDVSLKPFLKLNFDEFLVTETGFIARKSG